MTEEQIISAFIEYFYETDVDFKRPNKSEMIKFMEIYLKKDKEELDKKKKGVSTEEKDDGCVTPVNHGDGDGDQKQIITSNGLYSIISNNNYVKECKTNQKKDPSSLSYLIDRPLSHSDCIKLGIAIEKVISDIITKYTNYQNIKQKNAKRKKEKDHLFKDDKNKIIYYAELKGNLNLDTEKLPSTYNKCLKIVEDLKEKFPEYNIKWCLLGFRYLDYNNIPNTIKKKYEIIKNNLFGINQYLDYLNINYEFTQDIYKQFLNDIANTMVD